MKRGRHPANTLTGPRGLLGNKAKWLLSDLVCLGAPVPAPVALSSAPLRQTTPTVITGDSAGLCSAHLITGNSCIS